MFWWLCFCDISGFVGCDLSGFVGCIISGFFGCDISALLTVIYLLAVISVALLAVISVAGDRTRQSMWILLAIRVVNVLKVVLLVIHMRVEVTDPPSKQHITIHVLMVELIALLMTCNLADVVTDRLAD